MSDKRDTIGQGTQATVYSGDSYDTKDTTVVLRKGELDARVSSRVVLPSVVDSKRSNIEYVPKVRLPDNHDSIALDLLAIAHELAREGLWGSDLKDKNMGYLPAGQPVLIDPGYIKTGENYFPPLSEADLFAKSAAGVALVHEDLLVLVDPSLKPLIENLRELTDNGKPVTYERFQELTDRLYELATSRCHDIKHWPSQQEVLEDIFMLDNNGVSGLFDEANRINDDLPSSISDGASDVFPSESRSHNQEL